MVQSYLKAHGIEATLDNGYHAQNDWVMVPALSGIGLVAIPPDARNARELLIDAKNEAEANLLFRWEGAYDAPEKQRIFRKWSFPALYLMHPLSIVFYLALAGLLTVLENRRRDRLNTFERTPHDPARPL